MRYAGKMALSFAKRDGRTVADRLYRRGNSRLSANMPVAGDTPCYFLIATGGGYTEGESYRQDIALEAGTHAILTTQTPNYIYKCDHGQTTRQDCAVTVGDHALLEYYVDETIPYARAKFMQNTTVTLGEGASLILTDGITAGWSADETPFQYTQVTIHTQVHRGKTLLLNDLLFVHPEADDMNAIGYFEGHTDYHSAVLIDAAMDETMLDVLRGALEGLETPCRYAMSTIEKEGAVLRVLGDSADDNWRVIRRWVGAYREKIRGLAPLDLRKNRVRRDGV